MITALGWRTTFLMFAVVFAVIVLLCAFGMKRADDTFITAMAAGAGGRQAAYEELDWRQMLRRRNFWMCLVWAVILSAAGRAVINESTIYAAAFVDGDLTRAAALAGIVSIANGVGRVLSGQLFDMAGYRTAMLSVSALYLAAAGVLTLSLKTGSVPVLAAAFLLTGLAYGGVPPLNSAFTARFFGRKHYAVNFSIMNMNLIAASCLGPVCGGGSDAGTFSAIAAFAAVGAVITLLIRQPAHA